MLSGILDGGNSARFQRKLVRGKEIAASVGAGYNMTARLDSLFTISGTPAKEVSVTELEQAIKEELDNLKETLVSKEELERVKAQVVSSDVYEKDSVFYQAMVIGILETIGLDWRTADEYVGKVRAVTAEQVQAVAKKYFVDDSLTVATLDPQPIDPGQRRAPPGGLRHAQ